MNRIASSNINRDKEFPFIKKKMTEWNGIFQ